LKTIYFTLCSNNYLPFAKALGDSLLKWNPGAKLLIGLVDLMDPTVDYSQYSAFELIPCMDLGYPEFEGMLSRYNIIEFNTAVKPFYFEYLFEKYPEADEIFYLDPDLVFYQDPVLLGKEFEEASILLTPNLIFTQSKPSTGELASLRHGMYNLGFIGLKRGEESFRLIQWWKERLREHCRIDKCYGIFVDQKWMDLAPLFFDQIKSVRHPGWNMAWWNFSERKLFKSKDKYYVNTAKFPLVFFHFSGFRPEKGLLTERLISDEFKLEETSALAQLYEDYRKTLLANNYSQLSRIKPGLAFQAPPNSLQHKIGRKLKSKLNNLLYRIFKV
jgi:hypothetical protein